MASSDGASTNWGTMLSTSRVSLSPSQSTLAKYKSTIESSGLQRPTFKDRMQQTKEWLYNNENGLHVIMGRALIDWGKVFLACLIFVVALTAMSAGLCGMLWKFTDWIAPNMQGANSILQTPGLSFRPQPNIDSTLIHFARGCSVVECLTYIDHLEAYINLYEKNLQVGGQFVDCNTIRGRRKQLDKTCVFDVTKLGGFCVRQINYGYSDGQPCVLIKLNKVFGWVPEEYQDINEVPDAIKEVWDADDPLWIHVTCEGKDAASKELIGPIEITPKGFHFKYYPFRNQPGFRSPMVSVAFMNPMPGVLLMVTCRAYARNLVHIPNEMAAEVHFELLID